MRSRRPLGTSANRVTLAFVFKTSAREGEDAEKIVQDHIKLLHSYNEAKDAAQVRATGLSIHPFRC
jgi:hypothetical protein